MEWGGVGYGGVLHACGRHAPRQGWVVPSCLAQEFYIEGRCHVRTRRGDFRTKLAIKDLLFFASSFHVVNQKMRR